MTVQAVKQAHDLLTAAEKELQAAHAAHAEAVQAASQAGEAARNARAAVLTPQQVGELAARLAMEGTKACSATDEACARAEKARAAADAADAALKAAQAALERADAVLPVAQHKHDALKAAYQRTIREHLGQEDAAQSFAAYVQAAEQFALAAARWRANAVLSNFGGSYNPDNFKLTFAAPAPADYAARPHVQADGLVVAGWNALTIDADRFGKAVAKIAQDTIAIAAGLEG